MLPNEFIKKKAAQLVRIHETNDPQQLCHKMGITIYYRPFDTLLGMYAVIKRKRCIFVKDDLDEHQERLVIAHEIGHDQLHKALLREQKIWQEFTLLDITTQAEREANLFAAHLLLDDDDVISMLRDGYTDEQIARLSKVDLNLLLLKLMSLEDRLGTTLNLRHQPPSDFIAEI